MDNLRQEIIDHLQIKEVIMEEIQDELNDPDYQFYCELMKEKKQ